MMFIDELQLPQAPVSRPTPNSRRARSFLVSGAYISRIGAEYRAGGGILPLEAGDQMPPPARDPVLEREKKY